MGDSLSAGFLIGMIASLLFFVREGFRMEKKRRMVIEQDQTAHQDHESPT
jgi:hypothetical protein